MSDSADEAEDDDLVPMSPRARKRGLQRTTAARTIINTSQCKYGIVRRMAAKVGWAEVGDDAGWQIYWTDLSVNHERVRDLGPLQKLNHFPDMTSLCHKASSADILRRMSRLFPREYHFFPKSWTLPRDLRLLHEHLSATPEPGKPPPMVIIKPNKGCQGASIWVVRNVAELEAVRATDESSAAWVVQEYVDRPLLLDGYKFDLRIYALITSMTPLRIHLFHDGIARLCTEKYVSAAHMPAQPPPAVKAAGSSGGASATTGVTGRVRGGSAAIRPSGRPSAGGGPTAGS